jgi:AcrR family transcriptional regulator
LIVYGELNRMDSEIKQTKAGRPRNEVAQQTILKTALKQVSEVGFRAVSVESIAAEARVAKTTINRHWPNKAAVVMDAFLMEVEPHTVFPVCDRAIDSLRLQMQAQVREFRGRLGILIRALIGEAQVDQDMAKALRDQFVLPHRRKFREIIEEAMRQGDLRNDLDPVVAMDMIYAPIYFRLLMGHAPLNDSYLEALLEDVRSGLGPS